MTQDTYSDHQPKRRGGWEWGARRVAPPDSVFARCRRPFSPRERGRGGFLVTNDHEDSRGFSLLEQAAGRPRGSRPRLLFGQSWVRRLDPFPLFFPPSAPFGGLGINRVRPYRKIKPPRGGRSNFLGLWLCGSLQTTAGVGPLLPFVG